MSRTFEGVGVSTGIAIGTVHAIHLERLPVVAEPIPPERVDREIESFEHARKAARAELEELKHRVLDALGDSYAGILDAQLLILDDPELVGQTIRRIRVGRVSARWAIKEVVQDYDRKFAAVQDGYLREKGGDLSDVHLRLQRLLQGEGVREQSLPSGPLVVVAHSLGPSDAVDLERSGVVGLASDVGGRTSHTAILAQALGVPAVAGLRGFSQHARSGVPIVLDGGSGVVQLDPSPEELADATERRTRWLAEEERATRDTTGRARTRDGIEITIRANIEFPAEVENVRRFGAEGVGLYRSEFLFLSHSPDLPNEEDHYTTYRDLARAVAPHPAIVRTLDLGGEKYFHDVLESEESNPVLGLRAVRFCLARPDIFRPQLRGLLRAAVEPNLKIMLPLVTAEAEIRQVRRWIDEEANDLEEQGIPLRRDVPVGVMIEVPAAAFATDLLAREADFLSLGTNDLIQYSLAVDRGNESVNYLYQPDHPGVVRLLRFVVEQAARADVPLSLCGEMAADPRTLHWLIGFGVREFSMQARSIGKVRAAIAEIDSREAGRVAERLAAGSGVEGPEAWLETAPFDLPRQE